MATLLFRNSKLQGIVTIMEKEDTFLATYDEAVRTYEKEKKKEYDFIQPLTAYLEHKRPTLHLVKDSGIYLMPGAKMKKRPDDKSHICFAEGYEDSAPDIWQKCRDAVGGDDFVEPIDFNTGMKAAIIKGAGLIITITDKFIQVDLLFRSIK